jgi:hypothetical protein
MGSVRRCPDRRPGPLTPVSRAITSQVARDRNCFDKLSGGSRNRVTAPPKRTGEPVHNLPPDVVLTEPPSLVDRRTLSQALDMLSRLRETSVEEAAEHLVGLATDTGVSVTELAAALVATAL